MWLNTLITAVIAFSGLGNLFLAIYVYKKNSKAELNKKFFYFGLVLSCWCLTNLLSVSIRDLFWLRATYAVGSLVPISGIFFTSALSDRKIKKWLQAFLLVAGVSSLMAALFTSFLVKGVTTFYALGYDANFSLFFIPWGICIIFLIIIALIIPLFSIRKVDSQRKKQILYFLTGATVMSLWGITVSLILPFFGFTKFSDFDTPATIFLVGFTSYSIIKYNLMDISSLFFKAFIYALVIVAIIAFLLLLVFVSSFFFEQLLVWPIYVMVAVVSIALFFIGRLFFTEKRDLEEAKVNLTESLQKSEEDRRKAEIERDKTATIISSFSDGLIIIDEKGEISSINPRAENILELKREEALGKTILELDRLSAIKPINNILKSKENNIFKEEVEVAKGFILQVSVISIPLGSGGKDIGHLIILHDVSREKIAENMKTEFVSLAAHQLRTPLSIIKWSMSMLRDGDFGKINKKQNRIIENTFKGNERLIYLVNDLLDITRIEEGRYLYNVASSDMKEVVRLAIDSYKEEIKNSKIKIDFECPPNMPQMTIDAEKIKLVVQNLIDNAIKYSPEGSRILITLKHDNENIQFKIQDFGMGIPKNQQDKIFTKFFRGDNATKVNTVGTGLGLFLAQNIIEAHGGKIWFESEDDPKGIPGAIFYFSLPIGKNSI